MLLNPFIYAARGKASYDGTGDYLSLANSADFNYSSGAFAIELIVQFNTSEQNFYFIGKLKTTSSYDGWYLVYVSSTKKVVLHTANDTTAITSSGTFDQNVQHKIKLSSDGTTITMYIDGASQGTYTGVLQEYNNTFNIGWVYSSGLNGYTYGVRATKGRSRSAESVPDVFTIDDSDVVLCMNFGEAVGSTTFTDDCGKTVTTHGNVVIVE